MSKLTKNQKLALGKIEAGKAYTLKLLQVLTMLDWTSILKRLKAVGLILTLSSLCLLSWVRSVLWVEY